MLGGRVAEKADDIFGTLSRMTSGSGGGRRLTLASGVLDDYSMVKGWREESSAESPDGNL